MTLTDAGSQTPAGRWVTTNQALAQLGISERTLFRRLAANKLRRRTLDDGRIQVWLPLPVDRQPSVTPVDEPSSGDRQVADADRQHAGAENGQVVSHPSDADRQTGSRVADGDRQPSQALALFEQFNAAVALHVREALAPIERERDRLLQVSIDQAERIGRLEAELAHRRRRWWAFWRQV